jgi:hypothetical protein
MDSNSLLRDVFELPGESIVESSTTDPPTTGIRGINLNGTFIFAVGVF